MRPHGIASTEGWYDTLKKLWEDDKESPKEQQVKALGYKAATEYYGNPEWMARAQCRDAPFFIHHSLANYLTRGGRPVENLVAEITRDLAVYRQLLPQVKAANLRYIHWASETWKLVEHHWKDLEELKRLIPAQMAKRPPSPAQVLQGHLPTAAMMGPANQGSWTESGEEDYDVDLPVFKPLFPIGKPVEVRVQPLSAADVVKLAKVEVELFKLWGEVFEAEEEIEKNNDTMYFDDPPFRADGVFEAVHQDDPANLLFAGDYVPACATDIFDILCDRIDRLQLAISLMLHQTVITKPPLEGDTASQESWLDSLDGLESFKEPVEDLPQIKKSPFRSAARITDPVEEK
jgi:hypothetical protein